MEEGLSRIHDAIQDAALEGRPTETLTVSSFKAPPRDLELASEICSRNGTNLSAFLRNCVKRLNADYGTEECVGRET